MRAENFTVPLRRLNAAVVLSADDKLFEYSGMDTAVQLMNYLSNLRPDFKEPGFNAYPAGLFGFNIEENLTIAAFNCAVDGVTPPYWAWNCDHRAPNWFLDPYKHLCGSKDARDLVPLREFLDRFNYPAEIEIASALGSAVAARFLAQTLGLCL